MEFILLITSTWTLLLRTKIVDTWYTTGFKVYTLNSDEQLVVCKIYGQLLGHVFFSSPSPGHILNQSSSKTLNVLPISYPLPGFAFQPISSIKNWKITLLTILYNYMEYPFSLYCEPQLETNKIITLLSCSPQSLYSTTNWDSKHQHTKFWSNLFWD
jgi:hypothetical protein